MMNLYPFLALLLQQADAGRPFLGIAGIGGFLGLVLFIIYVAGLWKIFDKAGRPGWAAIIPIYNWYVLLKIGGRPGWWIILLFIPFVQFWIWLLIAFDISSSFGKGIPYTLGMFFFPFIFSVILGFGDAVYEKPAASQQMARDWRN